MAQLNSFILQRLCHNQFVFCFQKLKHYIEKHWIANFARFTLIINTTFETLFRLTILVAILQIVI